MWLTWTKSGKSLVYYFATTLEKRQAYAKSIKNLAKQYKEYLFFVTVDAEEYADTASVLGLTSKVFPALAVQNPSYGQVFPYRGTHISPETIAEFVLDIVEGKVGPWTGEEPSPPHDEL
jgi:protein disulfide-isomerase A1